MADDYSFLNDNEDYRPLNDEELFGKPKPMGRMNKLFSDPNFIQALATTGAGLDPNGVGGAVGNAAFNWSKNEATQKAAAKQSAGQASEMDRFIQSIQGEYGNKLVGDPEDMSTANKITLDHKGINVSYPNKSPRPKYSFADNSDMVEKPSSIYSGLGAEDLRGVDPENVRALMGDDERFTSRLFESGIKELQYKREQKAANLAAIAKAKADEAARTNSVADREDAQAAAVELQKVKDEAEMERLKTKLATGQPLSPSDQIAMEKLKLDIAKYSHDVKVDETKEERNKRNEQVFDREDVFDMSKTAEERAASAHAYNKKYDTNQVVYEGEGGMFSNGGPKVYHIPAGAKLGGKPLTSARITKIAEEKGMSIEEVIEELDKELKKRNEGK